MMKVLNWLSYPRAFVLTFFGALWTLLMSVLVLSAAAVLRHRPTVDFLIRTLWSRFLVWLAGVRIEVSGVEHVSSSAKGFLILFNHSSLFDILILHACFPRTFRFGAKIELFAIPFFGTAMRLAGALPIDRRNRNRVMKIYNEAITRVERGESFALAPEGTRQQESKLGAFKRGPFEFAINAQMDIVPVVIAGAFEVMPKNTVWINAGTWRRTVRVEILPPVASAGLAPSQAEALQERVRALMAPAHARLQAGF